MNLSVVIPTYKNKEMLLKNLRHNMQFLVGCEIIIVNDFPEESIQEDLKEFPSIKLIENPQNVGFGLTVNIGFSHASFPHIMLLNNDVLLTDTSYTEALNHFENDSTLFAVSFAQKEKDTSIVGKNIVYWQKGFLQHSKADNIRFGINAWAEGGSCIINKQKFEEIGGFDPIYSPFYWEDIDLSYQAWKKGYSILFDPSILVEHHHESTIGKYFDKRNITRIAFRNQLLFIWKHFSARYLLEHFFYVIKHVLYYLIKGDKLYLEALLQSIGHIPYIINFRKKSSRKRTDHEIISFFQK